MNKIIQVSQVTVSVQCKILHNNPGIFNAPRKVFSNFFASINISGVDAGGSVANATEPANNPFPTCDAFIFICISVIWYKNMCE